MKFLTFNIVVAVALVYLFTGGDWSLRELKESVFADSPSPEKPTPGPALKPAPQLAKIAIKTVAPPLVKKTPPESSSSSSATPVKRAPEKLAPVNLAPVNLAQAKPAEKLAPPSSQVVARRAEVLANRNVVKHAAPKTGLMTPDERRRSLLSIAEDMELFSVEAALR
jgi:hypothetical protein